MLAAAIGIDRAVEGNIGRVIARDDMARALERELGLQRRQVLVQVPAVILCLTRQRLEPAAC